MSEKTIQEIDGEWRLVDRHGSGYSVRAVVLEVVAKGTVKDAARSLNLKMAEVQLVLRHVSLLGPLAHYSTAELFAEIARRFEELESKHV